MPPSNLAAAANLLARSGAVLLSKVKSVEVWAWAKLEKQPLKHKHKAVQRAKWRTGVTVKRLEFNML
jgi:hypothetical protein